MCGAVYSLYRASYYYSKQINRMNNKHEMEAAVYRPQGPQLSATLAHPGILSFDSMTTRASILSRDYSLYTRSHVVSRDLQISREKRDISRDWSDSDQECGSQGPLMRKSLLSFTLTRSIHLSSKGYLLVSIYHDTFIPPD